MMRRATSRGDTATDRSGPVKAAGATVVMDLEDKDYGSREFSCRDPEGHLWNFGTYDPWRTGA